MTSPRFSILVPTRDRPATLRHTLATVSAQPGDDYEIVVADNCSGPETRRIVEALASPRVRYLRSDEVLPMADNWERGLALCSGEYITVLGDDDGLVPACLAMARWMLDRTGTELLTWPTHVYWWPDTIVPWNRDLLIVQVSDGATARDSRESLEAFYAGAVGFDYLPMIYKAFFHRRLIEEGRQRHGVFFAPFDAAPDIASGILGLHLTRTFVNSARPLSIRGNSGKSNGTAQWARSLGSEQREIYFREERIGLQGMIHRDLVPSPNLHVIVASAKLKCKEIYFPEDDRLMVDLEGVLHGMLGSLNFDPDAYEDNLRDIRELADKVGIELADVPPKQAMERRHVWGPAVDEEGRLSMLRVNCALLGVHDIAAASRLIDALLPPAA